ncbi:MAG: hypothetical protein ACE5MK_06115 [Acidobacteriota bacterium]
MQKTTDATRYRIPFLSRFLKDARPWGLTERHRQGGRAYDRQRTVPDPHGLLPTLGMRTDEHALAVAAHRGNWAFALARAGMKVTYSDVSRELTDHARENLLHENIVDYRCANYVLLPSGPEEFDWTFTFEAVGPKGFVLLLSLLNRRGGKYVLWTKGEHSDRKLDELTPTLALCEGLYGARGALEECQILCTDRAGRAKRRRHMVATVETNPDARGRMAFDLQLFKFFYKRKKAWGSDVCGLFHCRAEDLKRSLTRLGEWCPLFSEKYSRDVTIT